MTLTPSEAGQVLAAARLVDNRDFTAETAQVWAGLLTEQVTLPLAFEAIRHHYATSEKYLMPVHINDYVVGRRAEQLDLLRRAGEVDFPPALTPEQERKYRAVWQGHVKAGMPAESATQAADRELGYRRAVAELAPMPESLRKQLAQLGNGGRS